VFIFLLGFIPKQQVDVKRAVLVKNYPLENFKHGNKTLPREC